MLAKIVFLIVGMACIACSVLAIRQSRLQTASEIVQAQVRINAMDERLAALRIAVAERVAPEQVRAMASGMTDLVPLAQAAGDVAREERERELAKAQGLDQVQPLPPSQDPGSLHNPDGTPRVQPQATKPTNKPANKPTTKTKPKTTTKPNKSSSDRKSTRTPGGAA